MSATSVRCSAALSITLAVAAGSAQAQAVTLVRDQAQQDSTHFPPEIWDLRGALYDARIEGGSGNPVGVDSALTFQVTPRDYPVANVEMLVDGKRVRTEHLCAGTCPAFTFYPGDVALLTPIEVEVRVVARDTEADPPTAIDPEDPGVIGISAEAFRVRVPRDTFPPVVTATHGNLVAGWANEVAEVVFNATDGTGIREARLIIDGTVRATATYQCDFTRPRPCDNRQGASLTANVAGLASGLHTWQLEVVDGAGNVARTPSTGFETDWIRETIVAQMNLPDSDIVSVGVNDDSNVNALDVGMTNPTGLEATDLKARFGDAISIHQEEQIESLAGEPTTPPAAGRDSYRDPMLAGVRIYPPGRQGQEGSCTAGFMFHGRRTDDVEPDTFEGVITAGHCLFDNPLTLDWRQGGQVLGTYFAHKFVNPTYADAGAILTCCGTGAWRDISNRVFIGGGDPTVRIRDIAEPSSGNRGDPACISGAYGGYSCGEIDKVGKGRTASGKRRGFDYTVEARGRKVTVRNVYRMLRLTGECRDGDSGAPVFRLTGTSQGIQYGTAMGIAFARAGGATGGNRRCYFAQQTWVEWALNVRTYLGG